MLTYLLSWTVSKLWLINGHIFVSERGMPRTLSLGWSPANIAMIYRSKTRFFGLHFRCRKYWCIFNHFYVIRPESYRIRWNYTLRLDCRSRSFNVTEFGTNGKLCDLINTNSAPISCTVSEIQRYGPKSLYSATPLVFTSPDGEVCLGRSP